MRGKNEGQERFPEQSNTVLKIPAYPQLLDLQFLPQLLLRVSAASSVLSTWGKDASPGVILDVHCSLFLVLALFLCFQTFWPGCEGGDGGGSVITVC